MSNLTKSHSLTEKKQFSNADLTYVNDTITITLIELRSQQIKVYNEPVIAIVATFVDRMSDRHPLFAALRLGDSGHDDDAGVSRQNSTFLSTHPDQLDGRRDVEEQEEAEGQEGREEGVQVHVVDLVVVDVLS